METILGLDLIQWILVGGAGFVVALVVDWIRKR